MLFSFFGPEPCVLSDSQSRPIAFEESLALTIFLQSTNGEDHKRETTEPRYVGQGRMNAPNGEYDVFVEN